MLRKEGAQKKIVKRGIFDIGTLAKIATSIVMKVCAVSPSRQASSSSVQASPPHCASVALHYQST